VFSRFPFFFKEILMFGFLFRLLIIGGIVYAWDYAHKRYVIYSVTDTPAKQEALGRAAKLLLKIHSRYREARYTYELALRLTRSACKNPEDHQRVDDIHQKFLVMHDGAVNVEPSLWYNLHYKLVDHTKATYEVDDGRKVSWNLETMAKNTGKIRQLTQALLDLKIFTDPLPLMSDQELHEEARGAGYVAVYEEAVA
jgi:hypothetical protein